MLTPAQIIARLIVDGLGTPAAFSLLERSGSFVRLTTVPGAGWWTGTEAISVDGTNHQQLVKLMAHDKDPRVEGLGIVPGDDLFDCEEKALRGGWVRYQFPNDPRLSLRNRMNGGVRPYAFQAQCLDWAKDFIETLILNELLGMEADIVIASMGSGALFQGTAKALLGE